MSTQPFPRDFYWGYATASAQVEGSVSAQRPTTVTEPSQHPDANACPAQPLAGGRKLSIWDTFSRDPSHSEDGGSTEPATDFYNKWHEDILLMKEYGA
jgi:beta-glucosidase